MTPMNTAEPRALMKMMIAASNRSITPEARIQPHGPIARRQGRRDGADRLHQGEMLFERLHAARGRRGHRADRRDRDGDDRNRNQHLDQRESGRLRRTAVCITGSAARQFRYLR